MRAILSITSLLRRCTTARADAATSRYRRLRNSIAAWWRCGKMRSRQLTCLRIVGVSSTATRRNSTPPNWASAAPYRPGAWPPSRATKATPPCSPAAAATAASPLCSSACRRRSKRLSNRAPRNRSSRLSDKRPTSILVPLAMLFGLLPDTAVQQSSACVVGTPTVQLGLASPPNHHNTTLHSSPNLKTQRRFAATSDRPSTRDRGCGAFIRYPAPYLFEVEGSDLSNRLDLFYIYSPSQLIRRL
mmetsp:Transcript_97659/g.203832  ORF Transcript_97659/g.203832 Transcript_97659/m.203832 type:complete len:245 (-) Transcript_97659:210-944(-)